MKRRILGKTKLEVSVMGLGCGGHSRLGQAYGNTADESIHVVRTAIDEGINFIDTAQSYGTEEIVGRALETVSRQDYLLSTKVGLPGNSWFGRFRKGRYFEKALHRSLKSLKTDYIDLFNFHAVPADQYRLVSECYTDYLLKFKEQGKIRFIGITEAFGGDPTHEMLKLAVKDSVWDVIMAGLNFVNQSALQTVFPQALEKELGIQIMFAVRRGLVDLVSMKALVSSLVEDGVVDPVDLDPPENPLGFLLQPGVADSLTDAAYRFCAHIQGSPVVLSGTGNPDHLRVNAASLNRPPLPQPVVDRLQKIFSRVQLATGN